MSDVSSRITTDFLAYLRERAIPVTPLVADLELCIADLARPGARLTWSDFTIVLERFVELIGGIDEFERFLLRSIEQHPAWMRSILSAASLCASLETLYRAMNALVLPLLFRRVRSRVLRVDASTLRVRLQVPETLRASPTFFATMMAGSRTMPLLLGLPMAKVEGEVGQHHVEVLVKLPKRLPLVRRARAFFWRLFHTRAVLEEAMRLGEENVVLRERAEAAEGAMRRMTVAAQASVPPPFAAAQPPTPKVIPPASAATEVPVPAVAEMPPAVSTQLVASAAASTLRLPLRTFLAARFAEGARRAANKGVILHFALDPELPEEATVAIGALDEISARLIDHALAVTVKGSISAMASLDCDFSGVCGQLVVRIRDGGDGKSLGIDGLRPIARACGGNLVLEAAAEGRGAIIALSLPLMDVPPPRHETSICIIPRDATPRLRDVRVLIVEDEDDIRLVYAEYLRLNGALVDEAADGAAGMSRALASEYDLLILDVQMPHLDGYEVARRLRDAGYGRPIIALTAHALVGERERALLAGCDEHVTKPIELGRLAATVAKWTSAAPVG